MTEERLCLGCGVPLERRDGEAASSFAKRKNCDKTCAVESRGSEPGAATLYRSRFGGGWLHAAQFLAESMCDRRARHERTSLAVKFWTKEPWKSHFLQQVMLANRLLKKTSAAAVMRALRTPKGKQAYSLGAKWLGPLAEAEQARLDRQEAALAEAPPVETELPSSLESPRPAFTPVLSLLSKLRDL